MKEIKVIREEKVSMEDTRNLQKQKQKLHYPRNTR